jgi:hypothetical protein
MMRYQLTLGEKTIIVRLEPLLADLLALRLGACPQSSQARRTVRAWLQQQLDHNPDPGRVRVSRWLTHEALLFLVDKPLSDTYLDWLLEHPDC